MKKSCETVPLNVGVFKFLNLDLYFKIDELKSMLTSGGAEILRNLDSFDTRQVFSFSMGICIEVYNQTTLWIRIWIRIDGSPGTGSVLGMRIRLRIQLWILSIYKNFIEKNHGCYRSFCKFLYL